MELSPFFKSIVEQDLCAVVVCDTAHTVIYMNPAAITRYASYGGAALVGSSLLRCHNARSAELIEKVLARFAADSSNDRIFTSHNFKENKDVYMVALRNDAGRLIGYYEKHEYRDRETTRPYDL